ncbi:MAG: hypothetical protein ACOC45_06535 [Alkalispirochaetaceae bacterium]
MSDKGRVEQEHAGSDGVSQEAGAAENRRPRPEELIAEIYRQLRELQEAGKRPASVVMTMAQYRAVQRYHASLGETPAPAFDYISRYSIMGLSVLIDNNRELTVLPE